MVDAREADYLTEQPPLDLAGLEDYAEGSASQLLYAHLAALGVKSRDADHAASHLGKAVGLTTLLRASAVHASRRRSYLPLDLCAKHGVSQEDVYRVRETGSEGGTSEWKDGRVTNVRGSTGSRVASKKMGAFVTSVLCQSAVGRQGGSNRS